MSLKIRYVDGKTNQVLRETILDNEDMQAFEYIAYDVMDWIDNCFQNRIRQAIDTICEEALGGCPDVILSDSDKSDLAPKIGIVGKVKEISPELKKEIVRKATFKSGKERTENPEGR
jgi:hypothetical protein|tara:strand:- start:129 stop:479 length:351 start_codon:yes stop_codon:yes gene_type:complete